AFRSSRVLLVLQMMKQLAIIGSTGSIGQNTLKVVQHFSNRFQVFALSAHSSVTQLAEQIAVFRPKVVALTDPTRLDALAGLCREQGTRVPELLTGDEGLKAIASAPDVDVVVSAAVGAAGLLPTCIAVEAGKTVALANKESMVLAGELLRNTASRTGARILPVDSEHSAIDQCLRSGHREEVRRLLLTASGGPFRNTSREKLEHVTPEDALNHPTWRMGRRITIDSATLMNKGLEVIEARWLFDIPEDRVDIVVHPQSIVHSMVEFMDGSVIAQLGTTDMRQPIQYALTWPDRLDSCVPGIDWSAASRLEFIPPDTAKFPCIDLAYRAIRQGGTAPAVLNAADEIAVQAFLDRRIPFTSIPRLIEESLDAHQSASEVTFESVMAADFWARRFAQDRVDRARMAKS
ncbi:MAG TPA: 1-deoxy-D-xylulose-5-phosphate reductoisomerase, partial [Terriglobia bacterium]|nr:1-deoxy-D-xylulose-5-phosphate reductoisomerase [Terriglobia bacterium]